MCPETVSVVIPNWNSKEYLRGCLTSLLQQTQPPHEILVVDNASQDGSPELVRQGFPQVDLTCLPTNGGFTAAVNAGILRARGSLVALLNQDADAAPAWIESMAKAAQAHPEAGAIACKVLLYDQRDRIHSAGDLYTEDGVGANRGVWQRDRGQYDSPGFVFGACGAAAAYRRELFDRVGLFEERFFMYYEDVDMAWRHQLAGYSTFYAPQAVVYHRLGASGGGVTASYFGARNTIFVLVRDWPMPMLRRHWRGIVSRQLRIASDALRAGRGAAARARMRGLLAGILTWPRMIGARRAIQSSRTVGVEYLESLLTPIDETVPAA